MKLNIPIKVEVNAKGSTTAGKAAAIEARLAALAGRTDDAAQFEREYLLRVKARIEGKP